MRRILSALIGVTCLTGAAMAGPNEGGALIINSTGIAYLDDGTNSYCDLGLNGDCESANPNEGTSPVPLVWTIHAAFVEGSRPRLSGVTFGLDNYDGSSIRIVDFASCGDFELPTASWPAPGTGTAVIWNFAQTDLTTQVYWIAGYEYYGSDINIGLQGHPNHGGDFADDSVPAILDPIDAFGSLGFNNDPGFLPCPVAGDPAGACCIQGELECVILTLDECNLADGDYEGDFTRCSPDPCPKPGACCFDSGICVVLEGLDCGVAGGIFEGDNTSCDPNPCSQPGACCVPDGACSVTLEVGCEGDYQGDGTVCEPNPCPQVGACCAPNGTCTVTTGADCAEEYQGDHTVCEPNPCTQIGACCTPDGSCTITTEADCADDYQGDNTVCKPNTCPNAPAIGACCNARDGVCRLTSGDDCNIDLEFYRGNGTVCSPNRCAWLDGSVTPPAGVARNINPEPTALPTGACCSDDGSCSLTPEEMCAAGEYRGDDSVCDPTPCDLIPTLERSWGWIKFTYR